MAPRRFNINLAGQSFGFDLPTLEGEENAQETQSVLSQYFPELKLTFGTKTQRGGRLGRSSTSVTPEISLRQREAAVAGAATPIQTAPATTAPATSKGRPSTEYGLSNAYFGGEDYWRNLEKGFTPQEIKEFAQMNPQLFREQNSPDNPEGLYQQIMRGKVAVQSGLTSTQPQTTGTTTQAPTRSERETNINALYKTVLGREADPQGLQDYTKSSLDLPNVYKSLYESPEKKKQQVNELYKTVLGRDIDPEGLAQYTQRDPRSQGGFTPDELESIKTDLFASAEYKAKGGSSSASQTATAGLADRPTFRAPSEYESEFSRLNLNSAERIGEARKALGLNESTNPYLGLLAAADFDANTNDFTDEEADYAKELARRAQTSGDKRFAGQDLGQIYSVIDTANRLDRDIFKPGERELRAGSFLTGTGQTGFMLGDYLKSVGKTSSGGAQNKVTFYK